MTQNSLSDTVIEERIKDQELLALVDSFLTGLGVDRQTVPMGEVTDFALDLRNIVTGVSA